MAASEGEARRPRRPHIAERVKTSAVARMTGLSQRAVQLMALRGEIPGAAKLSSVWTFDPDKVRCWIAEKETEAAGRAEARRASDWSGPAAAPTNDAYMKLLGLGPYASSRKRR